MTALEAGHHGEPTSGGARLTAPRVGTFTARVGVGALIRGGDVLGALRVLNTRVDVVVPGDVTGLVTALHARIRDQPVDFGAPLVDLAPLDGPGLAARGDVSQEDGELIYRATMDGQFYRRPSPGAPEFAPAGARVQPGDTIGLIEVMKFFYPVALESVAPVLVVRWLVADATPVGHGTPLVALRRAP